MAAELPATARPRLAVISSKHVCCRRVMDRGVPEHRRVVDPADQCPSLCCALDDCAQCRLVHGVPSDSDDLLALLGPRESVCISVKGKDATVQGEPLGDRAANTTCRPSDYIRVRHPDKSRLADFRTRDSSPPSRTGDRWSNKSITEPCPPLLSTRTRAAARRRFAEEPSRAAVIVLAAADAGVPLRSGIRDIPTDGGWSRGACRCGIGLRRGRPGHRRVNTLGPRSGLGARQSANTDQQMALRRA